MTHMSHISKKAPIDKAQFGASNLKAIFPHPINVFHNVFLKFGRAFLRINILLSNSLRFSNSLFFSSIRFKKKRNILSIKNDVHFNDHTFI